MKNFISPYSPAAFMGCMQYHAHIIITIFTKEQLEKNRNNSQRAMRGESFSVWKRSCLNCIRMSSWMSNQSNWRCAGCKNTAIRHAI